MDEQSLKPVIENLEDLFSKFNKKFYKSQLYPLVLILPEAHMDGVLHGEHGVIEKKLLILPRSCPKESELLEMRDSTKSTCALNIYPALLPILHLLSCMKWFTYIICK